jgi:hypothetical protein
LEESLSEQEIWEHRVHKLRMEIEAARRVHRLGLDPLVLWDQLTHSTFEMAKFGLRKRYPEASEQEIFQMLRDQAMFYSSKPRRKNG